ncbi:MAG: hypothetical protein AMS21_10115, partial [Gemmatimonas sp. SG8_38_2]
MRAKSVGLAVALVLASTSAGLAQDRCGGGLNLTVGCSGLSIGNSESVNGLRINWSDSRLGVINGVNSTLWKPKRQGRDDWLSPPRGTVNGLAVGLFPAADYLNGISLGLAAVVSGRRPAGL